MIIGSSTPNALPHRKSLLPHDRTRSRHAMSDWQRILHESVDMFDKLVDKFGRDVIDVEALQPAFDNFQVRIISNSMSTIKEIGDPMWQQYVSTTQEFEIIDGVIDSLDEDGN